MAVNTKEDHPSSKLALSTGQIKPGLNHTPGPAGAALTSFAIPVQNQERTADATTELVGGPVGESIAGTDSNAPANKGFVTDFGSRVSLVGDVGGEAIEIVHQSGAHITVRPDGSIAILAHGKKGGGIMAPEGDASLSAPSGKVTIVASDVVFQSKGDIRFVAAGNIKMEARDITTKASGSMETKVDGRAITSIGSDNNLTVGGAYRQTVAGDIKMQTPNKIETDSNYMDIKTTKDFDVGATGSFSIKAKEDSNISSMNDIRIKSAEATYIRGKRVNMYSELMSTINSDTQVTLRGINIVQQAWGGTVTIDADETVEVSTKDMMLSASASFNTYGQTTYMNSDGEFNIDADGAIDIRGSTIDLNKGAPAAVSPKPIEVSQPKTMKPPTAPNAAEYPGAREIIGSMTTRLDAPEFYGNAYNVPANEMASYENEGQQPDQKAKQIALGNKGGGSRIEPGNEFTEAYVNTEANEYVAEETPYPSVETTLIPDVWSRYVTYFPGQNDIPLDDVDKAKEIISNIQHLCHNVLDKLIGQYGAVGGSFEVIRGFSAKSSSSDTSKHTEGLAVNIRSVPQDNMSTVEIAKWAAHNLAFDVVRLEKDEEGNVSVHIEAAPAGSKGKRLVETDSDKTGNPKPGLHYIESTIKLDGR